MQNENIMCQCGARFYGLEGKEDTCPDCLKEIIQPNMNKYKVEFIQIRTS